MEQKKAYSGIDIFRFVAAILVITNHTAPLAGIDLTASFILSNIVARLSVPFFFMTSGFFLIRSMNRSNEKLWAFMKKTAVIYLASIVLCLPLNLYNGYFSSPHFAATLLRDILLTGTMYHLWYLPASILGAFIAWFLVKKTGFKNAFIISLLLYAIRLLGGSYFGFIQNVNVLNKLYLSLFEITETTRNGIFFAPLFFTLGGYLYHKKNKIAKPLVSFAAFIISFGIMCAEALVLRHLDVMQHNSMYLLLPVTSLFLFMFLMSFRGKRYSALRDCSLVIYIIHPILIVAVRMVAKFIGMTQLFVDNKLIMFICVTIASVIASLIFTKIKSLLPKKNTNTKYERAWIELDLNALRHDVNELRRIMPDGCSLMAVLKDRAYGHSVFETVSVLEEMGVDAYAVATADEAIQLRYFGVKGTILILGYTDPSRAGELHKKKLCQTVFDLSYAKELNARNKEISVHIAIDSGMHRIGIDHSDIDSIAEVFSLKNLRIDGIFSHLCVSDSSTDDDISFTNTQISNFKTVLNELSKRGLKAKTTHLQNSYGLINYPDIKCDYARIGIALYGVDSENGINKRSDISLKPVLSLRTKIIQIRNLPSGQSVGYGRAFTTERESRIAVIPIGYADGLPRSLSGGKASVIINGQTAPIIGRICMDQCMVDVTDVDGASVGSVATVIGTDNGVTITAEDLSAQAETITNELLSRLGRRFTVITK